MIFSALGQMIVKPAIKRLPSNVVAPVIGVAAGYLLATNGDKLGQAIYTKAKQFNANRKGAK